MAGAHEGSAQAAAATAHDDPWPSQATTTPAHEEPPQAIATPAHEDPTQANVTVAGAHEGLAQAAAATAHDDPSHDTAHTHGTLRVPSRSTTVDLLRISPCVNSHSYG